MPSNQVDLINNTRNKSEVNAKFLQFSRTPGGSLAVGSNVITLTPMPGGISNLSPNQHYLRITGGTGAEEIVPVIGKTSTTITVTCANTHSGAWTIRTATSGIQEAVYSAIDAGIGFVKIPIGNLPTYAKIFVPDGISIRGGGSATVISPSINSGGVFKFIGTFLDLQDIFIRYADNTTSSMGTAIEINGVNSGYISNVKAWNPWLAIDLINSPGIKMSNLELLYCGIFGVHFITSLGSGGILLSNSTIFVSNPGGIGLRIEPTSTGSIIAGVQFGGGLRSIDLLANTADALNEVQISDFWFDAFTETGLRITMNHAGSVCNRVSLRNGMISGSANSNAILVGAVVVDQISNPIFENIDAAFEGTGSGVYLSGTRGAVLNAVNARSGDGGAGGAGLRLISPANHNVQVNGGAFGVGAYGDAYTNPGVSGYGVLIDGAAHSIRVDGARIGGSVTPVSNSSADINGVEFTKTCALLPIPTVASAAALQIPAFPRMFLSGNTSVTSITGLDAAHAGREITIIPTHATPGQWVAGGSIGRTFTPVQNVPFTIVWDGIKVY